MVGDVVGLGVIVGDGDGVIVEVAVNFGVDVLVLIAASGISVFVAEDSVGVRLDLNVGKI